MKKIAFILSTLVGFLNTTAQTYFSADLEDGIGNWTIVDSDGDGNNWSVIDFDDNEGSVLNSASFINQVGILTPDNWIITPAINLASSNAPTPGRIMPSALNISAGSLDTRTLQSIRAKALKTDVILPIP